MALLVGKRSAAHPAGLWSLRIWVEWKTRVAVFHRVVR